MADQRPGIARVRRRPLNLDRMVLDDLKALHGPSESYSDVIIRVASG